MKAYLLIFMLLLSSNIYSQSRKERNAIREQINELIQKTDSTYIEYATHIYQSKNVVCYLIDPRVASMELSDKTLVNGEILNHKKKKNKLSSKLGIVKLLSAQRKKDGPQLVRESTFLPDVSLKFHREDGIITMSCSSYDNMIRMATSKDDYVEFEDKDMCTMIIDYALSVFPKDKYLRYLQRKRQ